MKMRVLRRLRTMAPRTVKKRRDHAGFDVSDATIEPLPEPAPEAVFDRLTGPFGPRHGRFLDEET